MADEAVSLASRRARRRADPVQEAQRLAGAGLAIGDALRLLPRKLVDALIEVHRSRILQQMNRSAEIVGGGFAGLAAAWALARRGWRVRLPRRGGRLRPAGAGINGYENGPR